MPSEQAEDEVFVFGAVSLIEALPADLKVEDATRAMKFLLSAIGTSAQKLQVLIDVVHDQGSPQGLRNHKMALLLNCLLQELIGRYDFSHALKDDDSTLARKMILRYHSDRLAVTPATRLWDRRPFDFIMEFAEQANTSKDTVSDVIYDLLSLCSEAEHLFEKHNFDLFTHLIVAYGFRVNADDLSLVMHEVKGRVHTEQLGMQLMVAGILSVQNKAWSVRDALH